MKMIALSTLMVSLGLGACASTRAGDPAGAAECSADAAATLVGQVPPDDATILHRTGSTIVRRIAPGDPTTKDYRVERITVTVEDGRVVSASCG
ncbi:I78 family peptidase inhibitor [Sphingomonas sp. ac-8]|uniref:I78 family peptidase inhibitor n=1 Tax=Sphingomonas sp. ac-8 TaxID=3242977 RepID=UPI003A7FB07A